MAAEDLHPSTLQSEVVVNDDSTPPADEEDEYNRSLFGHPRGVTVARSTHLLRSNPPPPPLPTGWHLIPSRTAASSGAAGQGYHYYYYFHRETGECRWEYPPAEETTTSSSSSSSHAEGIVGLVDAAEVAAAAVAAATAAAAAAPSTAGDVASSPSATVVKKSILKRSSDDPSTTTTTTSPNNNTDDNNNNNNNNGEDEETSPSSALRNNKRARVDNEPREVRVLHILRKHINSRRPSSWRVSNITDTKEKAMADLRELHSILSDIDPDNPKELRATFEEFAKTESDCSSAKRGGDLGFFGRKKMQPAFEKASFSLGVGQMTNDIVDTSSGVHLILRLA